MLNDLFNPTDGAFAENIRSTLNDDLTELVESMKHHGWVSEFPALVDENGVVLVGHRRLKAAELAGIEPVTKTLVLGRGDGSDAERLRLAIVSNVGAKPLTKEDRQRISQHLYGSKEWTTKRIAEALNVSQRTISQDVRNLEVPSKSKSHPKTASNPKGAGRPKTTTAGESTITRKVREYVRPLIEQGEPLNVQEVAAATGHSRIVSEAAIAFERGRREGLKEAGAPVDVSELPKTAQEKLAAFERRLRAQLEAEFEKRVRDEVKRRLAERDAEDTLAVEQANELIKSNTGRQRPPFTAQEFKTVLLWAVHPNNNDPAKTTEAFRLLQQKKLLLCDEGPISRKSDRAVPLPKTLEEMLARRRARA